MIIGLVGTWVIILVAMLLGGSIMTYVDIPSVIMIFGGSITVVLFCFPMAKVKGVFGVGMKAVFWKSKSVSALIDELVGFAEIARRDGILSLESKCREVDDPFIVQGLQMAVDGTDPELIEQVLMNDLDNLVDRHEGGKAMFDAMTKYAPAIGMIGTLVGLVAMLADLSDPSAIGAGLAVALLTTLYGAMVANAFSGPLADRLARRSAEELLYKTIILKGVMSIQQGDNPRVVEQKLKTFLPPSERKAVEEAA